MPNNPWETRRPHDAIYPIGQPPTTPDQEQEELDMLAEGEHDVDCTGAGTEPRPWWQNEYAMRRQAAAMNRELMPDGCGFCGEPADAEMGEWWDPAAKGGQGDSIIGHAQCGEDSGLDRA